MLFVERLHLSVRSADADSPAIAEALREADFQVRGVRPLFPSLEDVFIERLAREEAA